MMTGRPGSFATGTSGFTLVELLAVVAILGILAAVALPRLFGVLNAVREGRAKAEIASLQRQVEMYHAVNGTVPATWNAMGVGGIPNDPWGKPYVYTKNELVNVALIRMEGLLVPVNSDYDLFSAGPDGLWLPDILHLLSQDDIVRARNGAYIGPASGY